MNPYLYFKTRYFEYNEQQAVQKLFYSNMNYKQADQALLRNYRYLNPYRISKQYYSAHIYGETPITTMAMIAKECPLSAQDLVIEMGAGRGRTSLFLSEYIGCKVLAYEQIPTFVEKVPISKNLTMIHGDMFAAPFSTASAVYLYGTLLTDEQIEHLCEKFSKNQKIITVSYPLSDYSENYRVMKSLPGRFAWGVTEIYLNERIS